MMTRSEFRQWCDANVRILDGATGTELIKQGMPAGVCPELWVLEHPESITRVQQAYAEAGSDIVYTATFGGNAVKLAEFGAEARAFEINKRLAEISRAAVAHLCADEHKARTEVKGCYARWRFFLKIIPRDFSKKYNRVPLYSVWAL